MAASDEAKPKVAAASAASRARLEAAQEVIVALVILMHSTGPRMVRRTLALAVLAGTATPALASAPVRSAQSTSYCLSGSMADGSQVRRGSVAMNRHPLGTRIRLVGATFNGRRRFVVRDRIGHSSELDFWSESCATARAWGRRTVRYVVIR